MISSPEVTFLVEHDLDEQELQQAIAEAIEAGVRAFVGARSSGGRYVRSVRTQRGTGIDVVDD
jgi:predicted peroxiredoxin